MAEVLKPFRAYRLVDENFQSMTNDLQDKLTSVDTMSTLVDRQYFGIDPFSEEGSPKDPREVFEQALIYDGNRDIDPFAVLDDQGEVVGAAKIIRGLEIKKVDNNTNTNTIDIVKRNPITRLFRSVFGKPLVYGPNITAWTADEDRDILQEAYSALVDEVEEVYRSRNPAQSEYSEDVQAILPDREMIGWTVEPDNSPKFVIDALKKSRFQRIDSGTFKIDSLDRKNADKYPTKVIRDAGLYIVDLAAAS